MGRAVVAAAAALGLAVVPGCDRAPTAQWPQLPAELGDLTSAARTSNPSITAYWRRSLDEDPANAELWLYRNDPEIGVNAHVPGDFVWADSIGTRLIRHAIYWHLPIDDALGQLQEAVAKAPDGAALLIVLHSKEVCVDYAVPGDRTATYERYADYLRVLASAAPRSGRVRVLYWQIYNEENYPGWTNLFGGPRMTGPDTTCAGDGASEYVQGQRYAELLKLAYPVVKEVTNDSGWVVMGGLGSIDTSTNVYSTTGRYAFLHGMYSAGAKDYFDIAAIQPYGAPGVLGIRRTSDMDRALALYGDETRPMFMSEFGSKEPPANHWPDLREQIESARSTRQYAKTMIFVMCGEDPYSLRLTTSRLCDTRSAAFSQLGELRYNADLYAADSVHFTDVVIHRRRDDVTPVGYDVVDEGNRFVIRNVAVHFREPTRIRFAGGSGSTGLSSPGIQYRVFVDRFGWTDWVTDSAPAGSVSHNRPIHAVQARTVRDAGFRALYAVFQGAGWTDWASNGVISGDTNTAASGLRATLAYRDGVPVAGRAVCYQVADLAGNWLPAQCDAAAAPSTTNTILAAVRMWLK